MSFTAKQIAVTLLVVCATVVPACQSNSPEKANGVSQSESAAILAEALLASDETFLQAKHSKDPLGMIDAAVGGKTGVNHELGKNLIGAFHQPQLVMIDTDTLLTLPDRELKAGLAEVIKYGASCDVEFFGWLEENMPALLQKDPAALAYAIQRSCEIKAEVVAEDEREAGRRAILNFGHTFGHAIEHCQGYGEWLHGEAVAAGMVMAAHLSGIDELQLQRLVSLLDVAGLPVAAPQIDAESWMRVMGMDKKVEQQQLRFVLLRSLGDAYVTTSYDSERLQTLIGAAA